MALPVNILRPVETLQNEDGFFLNLTKDAMEEFETPGEVTGGPGQLHDAVDEALPHDGTETFIASDTSVAFTAKTGKESDVRRLDFLMARIELFQVADGTTADKIVTPMVISPNSTKDWILRIHVSDFTDPGLETFFNDLEFRFMLFPGGTGSLGRKITFPSSRNGETVSNFAGWISAKNHAPSYPRFDLLVGEVSFTPQEQQNFDYTNATLSMFVRNRSTWKEDRQWSIAFTQIELEPPPASYEETFDNIEDWSLTADDPRFSHHIAVMRSVANTLLDQNKDEGVTLTLTVTSATNLIRTYGLLNRISTLNLRRWSDLDLQVMSIRLDFSKNSMAIQCSNDIFKVPSYREIITRMDNAEIRARQQIEVTKEKNRISPSKRTRPFEDRVPVDQGGFNILKVPLMSRPVGDGFSIREVDTSKYPIKR